MRIDGRGGVDTILLYSTSGATVDAIISGDELSILGTGEADRLK